MTKASCYHTNFSRHLCNTISYNIYNIATLLFVHSVDNVEMFKKKTTTCVYRFEGAICTIWPKWGYKMHTHNDSDLQGRLETSFIWAKQIVFYLWKLVWCLCTLPHCFFHFPFRRPAKTWQEQLRSQTLKSTVYERGDKNNKSLRQACFCNKAPFPANRTQNTGGSAVCQKLLSNVEKTNRGRNKNKRCLKSRGCSGL